ncbi:(Fe-S)-binding protein [Aeropyrum camini]|uniref:Fe-S oxidoreductase n=1 Tax=Aeropyrum camini SY1 = JCM 12091 TaxID=1198449 RepID=U3TG24_9CREN|nr:(Fe-S)-binding protein [Aeropyrum camini]BAN90948.1 Fe-S oxidoreductase [Aeropyrum camini SY1 = JCM 12091]
MARLKLYLALMKTVVEKTGLPVPAPRDVVYRWARGEKPPRRGRAYLFTGGLYQLAPYIRATVRLMERLESIGLLEVGLRASKVVPPGLARLAVRPPGSEVRRAESIVSRIYRMLRPLEVAYPYDADAYSGAILYENGLESSFEKHINRVYRRLRESGVERIVTIDPHTTHIMRTVAPKYVDGYSLEVESYLEVLDRAGGVRLGSSIGEAVIHDPCYYARFENVIGEPRRVAERAGLRLKEPPRAGRMTYCCGGPVEGLMPRLAKRIARARLEELESVSRKIVVACPICMINLGDAAVGRGVEVLDISEALEPVSGSS